MGSPSHAQIGLAKGLEGLLGGIERGQDRKLKQALMEAQYGADSPYRQQQMQLQRDKLAQQTHNQEANRQVRREYNESILKRAGGLEGDVLLGDLLGMDEQARKDNPHIANTVVPAKQRSYIAKDIVKMGRPGAGAQKQISEGATLGQLGVDLSNAWKQGELKEPGVKQLLKGSVSKVLPSGYSEKIVGKEYAAYDDLQHQVSEVALRQATGAATNPGEISNYANMLPRPGMSPELAAQKIRTFYTKVRSKANEWAGTLEAQGQSDQARRWLERTTAIFDAQEREMLQNFNPGAEPKPRVPRGTARPTPTAGKSKADDRLNSLGL